MERAVKHIPYNSDYLWYLATKPHLLRKDCGFRENAEGSDFKENSWVTRHRGTASY